MKKLLLLTATLLSLAAMATFFAAKRGTLTDVKLVTSEFVESIASGEEGLLVTCRCSWWATECAVGNWGGVCAGGVNFECESRDSNCR